LSTLVTQAPVRFSDLVAAEWIKLRSQRSTRWLLTLVTLFVVGSGAAASLSNYHNAGTGPGARELPDYLPFEAFAPPGFMTLMLVAGSAGALCMTGEYASGLIRTTTAAVPARGSVLSAKAVVVAAVWTVVGAVVAAGCFAVSQAIWSGRGLGVPFTHPGVARGLAASALVAPVSALVGLGLAVLIRHSAATMVTTALALLLLPEFFSDRTLWSADIRNAMVFQAWRRLVQPWEPDPGQLNYSPTVAGSWVVYLLWPLLAVAVAVVTVRRRDV